MDLLLEIRFLAKPNPDRYVWALRVGATLCSRGIGARFQLGAFGSWSVASGPLTRGQLAERRSCKRSRVVAEGLIRPGNIRCGSRGAVGCIRGRSERLRTRGIWRLHCRLRRGVVRQSGRRDLLAGLSPGCGFLLWRDGMPDVVNSGRDSHDGRDSNNHPAPFHVNLRAVNCRELIRDADTS